MEFRITLQIIPAPQTADQFVFRKKINGLSLNTRDQAFGKMRMETNEREAVVRYGVVIEKAVNNYSAYVPDLPGCVATGSSVAS
jgi:hypothetical protein